MRVAQHHLGAVALHIHRQVHDDGATAAGEHLRKRALEDTRQPLDPRGPPDTLGDGLEHGQAVRVAFALDLLQHAPPGHVGVAVAGEYQHRDGVHVAGGQADTSVHRARADRGKHGQRETRDAIVAIGHVDPGALVHHWDGCDLVLP